MFKFYQTLLKHRVKLSSFVANIELRCKNGEETKYLASIT